MSGDTPYHEIRWNVDFIIALFYAVDQEMLDVPKHPEAKLYPS
jgi:hypothetical protein